MKTNYLFIFAVLLAVIGCKKQDHQTNGKPGSPKNLALVSPAGVTVYGDMLHFPDFATVEATLDALNAELENYDDDFVAAHSELTLEELNDYQDLIGYNAYQPLVDFENQYAGFSSLRKKISDEVAVWLDTDGDNVANDPDNHYIISEDIRTILNDKDQIRVGNIVYMLHEQGWIEVYNADLAVVADIEAGVINPNDPPTPETLGIFQNIFQGGSPCDNTVSGHRMDDYAYNSAHNRRIKWKLVAENNLFTRRVKGKIDGFRKKNNGKWKAYRSDLTVRIRGTVVDKDNCVNLPFFDVQTGPQNKQHIKAISHYGTPIVFKKDHIEGIFIGADGVTHVQKLTW